ncbi:MAG: hypothetical protein WBP25_03520 [Giesbergeria sp.]
MQTMFKSAITIYAVVLAGCAFSPPSFRVVSAGESATAGQELKRFEILAPGVQRIALEGGGYRYLVDIPLATRPTGCRETSGKHGIEGRILPTGGSAVLRFTIPRFATESELRKAWDDWKKSAAGAPVAECLSKADLDSMPDRLASARPLNGEQSLEAGYGLSKNTPVVLLKPGMTVCASDGFMRNATASVFVSSGQSCTRVARSPAGGSVLDPMRYSLHTMTTAPTDSSSSTVGNIASWGEVPKEVAALQYLVRYPRTLPKPSDSIKPKDLSLLISLGNDMASEVREAAVKCIADADTDKLMDFCQIPVEQIAGKCDAPLLELKVKPQCYRFGERGVMSVWIPVVVNGTPTDVSVGALMGDAAARLGRAAMTPPASMMRWHGGRLHAVEIELEDMRQAFDLPLLPGDQISW